MIWAITLGDVLCAILIIAYGSAILAKMGPR